MSINFNERVNLLTELLNEGHLTNDEYLDLIESLRGGSINEDSVNGQSSLDAEYQREVMNPNKLDDYEKFLNGDTAFMEEDELFDPNFSDVSLDKREQASHLYQKVLKDMNVFVYDDYPKSTSAMGLYRQDIHSGSILRGCKLRVNTGGKVECTEPFHSHEHNVSGVTQDEIEHIRKLIKEGKINLS